MVEFRLFPQEADIALTTQSLALPRWHVTLTSLRRRMSLKTLLNIHQYYDRNNKTKIMAVDSGNVAPAGSAAVVKVISAASCVCEVAGCNTDRLQSPQEAKTATDDRCECVSVH
jgi:hypothetical protein